MRWMLYCKNPKIEREITSMPFSVGRGSCDLNISNATLSKVHFRLEVRNKELYLINQSITNPIIVNEAEVSGGIKVVPREVYRIVAGSVVFALAEVGMPIGEALAPLPPMYSFITNHKMYGPYNEAGLLEAYKRGELIPESLIWREDMPDQQFLARDVIVVEKPPQPMANPVETVPPTPSSGSGPSGGAKRFLTAEELPPVLGISFMCPYCRAVSELEDVLSVSVSPGLLGDDVLGEHEQRRFLPSNFTGNGLAIDADGGVCTAIACPCCHMTLPSPLLEMPQTVIAIIGAAGAGKSVFLASAVWRCRQLLLHHFGIGFMDMDPVANRWINAYEEKLFFQEDMEALQQIEKTEIHSSEVCRSILLNGESKLLPLPSFFSLKPVASDPQCLVVYDSAGEHFRAGADTSTSYVTLNMLTADVLFFMFDPSADPRFTLYLEREADSAKNYAQRQDILLSELSARIRRYVGHKGSGRLDRPLLIGISKSDMLRKYLPMEADPYTPLPDGKYALNFDVLKDISQKTEAFISQIAPELVATAKDIAHEVWFIPISSLGHNPKREGVRPKDITSHLIELPIVFTLATKGLLPTQGSRF